MILPKSHWTIVWYGKTSSLYFHDISRIFCWYQRKNQSKYEKMETFQVNRTLKEANISYLRYFQNNAEISRSQEANFNFGSTANNKKGRLLRSFNWMRSWNAKCLQRKRSFVEISWCDKDFLTFGWYLQDALVENCGKRHFYKVCLLK